jgi:hypothetical protein
LGEDNVAIPNGPELCLVDTKYRIIAGVGILQPESSTIASDFDPKQHH